MSTWACGEDLLRAGGVEGQVAGHDLHRVARSPQPGQVGLLGATRRHQLGTVAVCPRSPRSAHRDKPATGARAGRRGSARTEPGWSGTRRPGAARPGPTPTRQARACRRPDRSWPEIRAYADAKQGQQRGRIVVQPVQRHPGDPSILRLGPFRQQRRLAVARRRRDADHPAIAGARRLDQAGATHRTRPAAAAPTAWLRAAPPRAWRAARPGTDPIIRHSQILVSNEPPGGVPVTSTDS